MMAAFLVHQGATVLCLHSGTAQPLIVNPRVKVSGQQIVTQTSTYSIMGCSLTSPTNPFCASATWTSGATRVKAGGVPVVLQDSQATCVATGTGLNITVTQTRVKGT
jgi:hypothetical protein